MNHPEMYVEGQGWMPASSHLNFAGFGPDGERIPYAEPTPEPGQAQRDWLSGQSSNRLREIQNHFNNQYDLIRQHSTTMGIKRANEMITEAHLAAQQEYFEIESQTNRKVEAFQRVQNLAKQGAIATTGSMNPEKLMWQMVGGDELAEAMFPTIRDQRTDDQHTRFTEATRQRDILEKDLTGYQVVDEGRWNPFVKNTQALQKYDPVTGEYKTVSRKDMEGNVLMGEKERGQFRSIQQALKNLEGIRSNNYPGITSNQRASLQTIVNSESRIGSTLGNVVSAHAKLKTPVITKQNLKAQYTEIYQTQGPEAAAEFAVKSGLISN